ncbi:lysylphosphatidylglycerol synthase transmembrane domain-containing protein [Thermogemmatispora sp.]|uniref:lysylphosphatidylglycerol synthase transmembrane domain-containing protein n=1 Tax=Thermogemmatispora sp. TaxID=1968838 RepID=UPI001D6F028C|nr:lysylphosphatidylglycerol synthase transmembrane domain-containing protein [Thermogemmatispora sp.]MBX5449867.1 flippase-like domain-containing protein [Thermogemmatispora sp.]
MSQWFQHGKDDAARDISGRPLEQAALYQEGAVSQAPLTVNGQDEQPITPEQLSLGRRLLNWRTIVPLVIVLLALLIFLKQEKIDVQQTWLAIRAANPLFFAIAFVIYYLSFPLRAWRWRILLQNASLETKQKRRLPPFWRLVEIIYISWFANVLVPAKLGDLYRAYLLRQENGSSATRTFGTVLAERLLDLSILLCLCIPALMISLHERMPWQVRFGLIVTLVAVLCGIAALGLLRLLHEPIGKRIPSRLRGYYEHLQGGILGSFRHLPTLGLLTLAIWSCEALRFFFVVLALQLLQGPLLHLLAVAMLIALVEALLTVIPFTGGGVGLVEGGMIAMIALFRPNATSLALAAIVLDRTISLLSILVIGFIVFFIAFGRQTAKQSLDA